MTSRRTTLGSIASGLIAAIAGCQTTTPTAKGDESGEYRYLTADAAGIRAGPQISIKVNDAIVKKSIEVSTAEKSYKNLTNADFERRTVDDGWFVLVGLNGGMSGPSSHKSETPADDDNHPPLRDWRIGPEAGDIPEEGTPPLPVGSDEDPTYYRVMGEIYPDYAALDTLKTSDLEIFGSLMFRVPDSAYIPLSYHGLSDTDAADVTWYLRPEEE